MSGLAPIGSAFADMQFKFYSEACLMLAKPSPMTALCCLRSLSLHAGSPALRRAARRRLTAHIEDAKNQENQ